MVDTYGFKAQQKVGDRAEAMFQAAFPNAINLNKLDENWHSRPDFKITLPGIGTKLVEVKGEDYKYVEGGSYSKEDKTSPNLFVEVYSNNRTKTWGGPWKADSYPVKTDLYVFMSAITGNYYMFENAVLINTVKAYVEKHNPPIKSIPNEGYWTDGYAIPITVLKKHAVLVK
jgi:hypothetical protein